jgi:hypothetical protein
MATTAHDLARSNGRVTLDEADITALAAEFRGEIIAPGDATYDEARRVWNRA